MKLPKILCSNASSAPCAPSAAHEPSRRRRERTAAAGSLTLHPSPVVFTGFALFCLSLPVAVWAQGAGPLRSLLLALAAVPLARAADRTLLGRGGRAPRRLQWEPDGQFSLVLADGSVEAVQLQPGSLASARWLWLVLRGSNRYHLFVDRQRSDPSSFAAIRRRLRTFPPAGGL